jgi:heme A synthase
MAKQKKTQNAESDESGAPPVEDPPHACARLHLCIGWWSLLVFLTLGIGLEYLHAFRVRSYVDLGESEVRRLMWTLAHAHGVLISVVHLGFAFTVFLVAEWNSRSRGLASSCLTAAGLLMPLGFFLGGAFVYDGDPGVGVFLVPPGALLLFTAASLTGVAMLKARR